MGARSSEPSEQRVRSCVYGSAGQVSCPLAVPFARVTQGGMRLCPGKSSHLKLPEREEDVKVERKGDLRRVRG